MITINNFWLFFMDSADYKNFIKYFAKLSQSIIFCFIVY